MIKDSLNDGFHFGAGGDVVVSWQEGFFFFFFPEE